MSDPTGTASPISAADTGAVEDLPDGFARPHHRCRGRARYGEVSARHLAASGRRRRREPRPERRRGIRESRRIVFARVRRKDAAVGFEPAPGDRRRSRSKPWGLSLVFHPRNPYVPTTHCNVRFLVATPPERAAGLVVRRRLRSHPLLSFDEDVLHWHRTARDACRAVRHGRISKNTRSGATAIFSCRIEMRRAASAGCSSTISTKAASLAASVCCAASAIIFCPPTCRSWSAAAPPLDRA